MKVFGVLLGDKELLSRLEVLPTRMIERVDQTIGKLTLKLSRLARAKLLNVVVHTQTGSLYSTIDRGTYVQKTPWGIVGSVGATGATKKEAIVAGAVEYGSTHKARIQESLNASVFKFQLGGKFKFAKRVHIPAIKIPEHSFLRSALNEMRPEVMSALAQAARIED